MLKKSYFGNFKSIIVSSFVSLAIINFSNATEIKIGVLLPLTGSQAFYGKEAKNGIDLAIKNYNDPNLKIKLIVEDTQSTPLEAAKGINKLITSDKVSVVIAEVISSNAIAAASIAEKAKIPIISPAATNDAVTFGKKYVFRTCFIDSFQGVVMANFAVKNLNAKSAIILEDSDSDYSKGLSDSFKTTFTKSGGQITKVLKYSQKDTSFTAQLGDVRKLKPDVVFIPGFHQQVGVILREAKELGIKTKMLGGDGWFTPELRMIAKGAEIGGYTSTHYSTDSDEPKVKSFIENYSKRYQAKPSAHAALGYDTFNIIVHALKGIDKYDSEKITEALSKIKDFHGITGNITMDKNHNPIKPAVILEYVPNGYKYVTSIGPDKK
ncbi:ABC transporter substrate-binding protein [Pigmentibacter sp. JX0631]|uniref:ABC transporter substrate-binding protein n=1 Tax=Pigmentibacter sp. JX0631 TaxID=2976982 RepID=UPI002468CC06|nr:ABC transporter substrate-binding protein [Pigmentibacter sp. JX0631]WGL59141.1 ABC transporter substrate-binding protein [Pigmentibacter sp. JX0631]